MRNIVSVDKHIMRFDRALKTLQGDLVASRVYPAENIVDANLSDEEIKQSIALMRVNHVGEVCAQALYQAQALASDDPTITHNLEHAADDEVDHLVWTQQRITN